MPKVVIERVANGPIRVAIEAQGPALNLFNPTERRLIIRTTMLELAKTFIASLLPKRFTNYARAFLGYRAGAKYERHKSKMEKRGALPGPQPLPLVFTGESRELALTSARASVSGTGLRTAGIVRFARGAINFKKAPVLQTIPSIEVQFLAKRAHDELTALINSASFTGKNGTGKRLTLVGAHSARSLGKGRQRKVGA